MYNLKIAGGENPPAKSIMKYKNNYIHSQIVAEPKEQGESIEETLRRLTANKEPIPEEVPEIFTAAKDGVIGDYDIRHDRFDTAYEAADKFAASDTARAAERAQYEPEDTEEKEA